MHNSIVKNQDCKAKRVRKKPQKKDQFILDKK